MNPDTFSDDSRRILVLGAEGPVGLEIARIGRSLGHRITCVAAAGRQAAPEEPWVEGVDWLQAGPDQHTRWSGAVERADAVIWNWPQEPPTDDLAGEGSKSAPRLVVLNSAAAGGWGAAHTPGAFGEIGAVVLSSPPLYGADPVDAERAPVVGMHASELEEADGPEPQPFEVLAIAALRGAIESEHRGELTAAEVTRLGRAMYIH